MICRMWHGITPRSKADAYAGLLEQRALSGYRAVPGNISAQVLRRDEAEVTHFMAVTYWESEDSIRAFAAEFVAGLCERLVDGGAPGLHFYTLNLSKPTLNVLDHLR